MLSDQVRLNHPKETGGFLGGKNGVIQLVLPVFNQAFTKKESQFAMSSADTHRAHDLCHKNKLDYYGIYHNHPSGSNRPSFQDMNRVQRYLFILTLDAQARLTITAYQALGRIPKRLPVRYIKKLPTVQSSIDDAMTATNTPNDTVILSQAQATASYTRYESDGWTETTRFTTIA